MTLTKSVRCRGPCPRESYGVGPLAQANIPWLGTPWQRIFHSKSSPCPLFSWSFWNSVVQHAPKGPVFFFLGESVGSFGYVLFPLCSHKVSNQFSTRSQSVPQHVLNSTSLCPICLAQHCPLETYVSGQYGDLYNFMFEVNTSTSRNLQSFRICLRWANQTGSWSQEKKVLNLKGTFN
jgi:hypothetical protein